TGKSHLGALPIVGPWPFRGHRWRGPQQESSRELPRMHVPLFVKADQGSAIRSARCTLNGEWKGGQSLAGLRVPDLGPVPGAFNNEPAAVVTDKSMGP